MERFPSKTNDLEMPMIGRVRLCNHHLMEQTFHVLFVRPNGWSYELWPRATGEAEAVAKADELLEYVERVGIGDYLEPDGITVRGGAELRVTPISDSHEEDLHLRITRPDGTIIEK